jgi:hypothetical protein
MFRPDCPHRTIFALATLTLAAGLTLTGCYATGRKVDQTRLAEFHPGHTTCVEIMEALGPATSSTVNSDGTRQIVYAYTQMQLRPESFIPIAGAFLRGGDTEHTQVLFECDRRGILQTYSATQGQTGIGTGLSSGAKQK